jgi:hypothetical protein
LIDNLLLILEYLYIENHNFMDDYKSELNNWPFSFSLIF